jgi:putative SOS response-associated peptidase YedK
MCNLYSITSNQEAIRRLFALSHDYAGNLPALPAVFPDQMAPIVRVGPDGERELTLARWGMPGPPQVGAPLVVNLRNAASPYWRRWLGPANRCLAPVNAFCEYADTRPRKTPVWFARDDSRPLFAFAGVWTRWRGARGPKSAPVEGEHEIFAFLTAPPNAVVAPIHPKAMPVVLASAEAFELWLKGDLAEALTLQRPAPDDALRIVARGKREDP